MKILFWGAGEGCGTTSSMAAVAGYYALARGGRSFCMQLKSVGGDLELLFSPWEKRTVLKEESTYYALEGMDYLIWQEQHHKLDWSCMKECLLPFFDHRLFCLPSGLREKPGLYPQETGALQRKVAQRMEKHADLLFIDLGHEKGVLADELMQEGDAVVVIFSGGGEELEAFFSHPVRCRGRLLYLLANYSDEQVYNCANFQRIYRTQDEHMCMLPSNPAFAQACGRGRLEPFLKKTFRGRGSQRDMRFARELTRAVRLIVEAGADG